MDGMSTDAAKVLTEKLSLARELASLKPELEHLRSQSSSHQATLAEKLRLERQISTMEVELEAEKRAALRIAQKQDDGTERTNELQSQVDDLRKELAKEQREMAKLRKTFEKDAEHWERRKAVLESKVNQQKEHASKPDADNESSAEDTVQWQRKAEALQGSLEEVQRRMEVDATEASERQAMLERKVEQLRGKLRSVRDDLQTSKSELEAARAAVSKAQALGVNSKTGAGPQKRSIFNPDNTLLDTPEAKGVRNKRQAGKRTTGQAVPGEKSMFSITPFLNKTASIIIEPSGEDAGVHEELAASPTEQSKRPHVNTMPNAPLAEIEPQKYNKISRRSADTKPLTSTKKSLTKKSSLNTIALEKVTEEDVDEDQESESQNKQVAPKPVLNVPAIQLNEPIRKKRKLLGGASKTIFDDDDADVPKRAGKTKLMPSMLKSGLDRTKMNSLASFDTFSPLKKDRRGVGASFLA